MKYFHPKTSIIKSCLVLISAVSINFTAVASPTSNKDKDTPHKKAQSAFTVVNNGQVSAVLVLAKEAAPEEKNAAQEIQTFIEEVSGAKLNIITTGDDMQGKKAILIGSAASPSLDELIKQKGNNPYSFALIVNDGKVSLRGLSPAGTRVAAYELLEQVGVRWFMPGELGTVVPKNKNIQLVEQKTVQVPSFAARWTTSARNSKKLGEEWMQRVRMGGPNFPSSHGITIEERGSRGNEGKASQKKGTGKAAKSLFEEHPEYYALVDGKRKPSQLCISNPDVLKRAILTTKEYFQKNPDAEWIGMGPNDGRGFCECDNCKALDANDYDPIAHQISMTDRYVWFFNKVLDGIKDEYPTKKIGFYAYAAYMRPPVKVKPDSKIVPATAVIGLCRLHGMGDSICPEKSYEKQLTTDWGKVVPEVYNRGYWYNLSDPGLPFFMISRVKNEIPIGKKLGIHGWRVETSDNLAAELPSVYIAAKLMWDDKADVNALMDDFCKKFFGPAALPMCKYIDLMDRSLANADYHTGSAWDAPHIYNKEVCKVAQASLNQASKLAASGVYAKRVDMYRKDFDYLLAFNDMLEQRLANNYVAAQKSLNRFDSIGKELISNDPPLLKPLHVIEYTKRFFRSATEQGYKRVTAGNQMLAGLKKDWEVALDPERIGVAIGLWNPENTGGNWQKQRTDYSWSDQGLRYYKGLAWYRQHVAVPKEAAGKKLFLWFGGVDEKADVWVNGKPIGASRVGTFQPFELDATNALKPGSENLITVLITNDKLNELGTGGIVGPVMIWSPADKNAKPENGTGPAKDESMEVIMQTKQ
jgi:hypothetical protein